MSSYGNLGYIFFALNGSPPKGCAVYFPQGKVLLIISAYGKTTRYKDTIYEEHKTKKE